jgi:hypothetical protein
MGSLSVGNRESATNKFVHRKKYIHFERKVNLKTADDIFC